MDVHPDFHQIVDAHAVQLPVELGFEAGDVFVVGLQGLTVAGHGFVVNAHLLLKHTPALGHAGEQVRQALEGFPNHRGCRAVFLQFAVAVFVNTQVHKLAQVIEDVTAALFQVVQLALQVIKRGGRHPLDIQRLFCLHCLQVRETVFHSSHAFAQGRQFPLPFLNAVFLGPGPGGFLLQCILLFLLQTGLFVQLRQLLFGRLFFFGGVPQGGGSGWITLKRLKIFFDGPDFFFRAFNQLGPVVFLVGGVCQL